MCATLVNAQNNDRLFRAYIYNNEYDVYMRINFYDQDISIPGQELYGQLPGYLGKQRNSFCWVITACQIESERKASLQMINDFGSEDLKATLTCLVLTTLSTFSSRGAEAPLKCRTTGNGRNCRRRWN